LSRFRAVFGGAVDRLREVVVAGAVGVGVACWFEMVLFGESLTTLMQPGWEAHYIDYQGLKTIIAQIKQVCGLLCRRDAAAVAPAAAPAGGGGVCTCTRHLG